MFKNYFTIAWRNLTRNRASSIINVVGLAIGMTSAILVLVQVLWVVDADHSYTKLDRLYEVFSNDKVDGTIRTLSNTPELLAPELKKNYPGIEAATRIIWARDLITPIQTAVPGKPATPSPASPGFFSHGFVVDTDFFKMFDFPFIAGNPRTALNDPHAIIITESFAARLFHTTNAIGRTIRIGDSTPFKVTAVIRIDNEEDHSLLFHGTTYLISYAQRRYIDSNWADIRIPTYVLLKTNVRPSAVDKAIADIIPAHTNSHRTTKEFLYPFGRLSLHGEFVNGKESGGRIIMIRTFLLIAIFIILIACINFVNLSTAYSQRRAKEVGVRKVIGALRSSLLLQFLGESLIMTTIAGIIALFLASIAIPIFDQFTECPLYIHYKSPAYWACFIGFILVTGILAGTWPAMVLSSFRPVIVLKGRMANLLSTILARKVLVVFQFSIAIVLIISTVIVDRQLDYGRYRQVGYDRDRLLNIPLYTINLINHYDGFRSDLLNSGAATAVTESYDMLTETGGRTIGLKFQGSESLPPMPINLNLENGGLVETPGMQLIMGRDIDIQRYPTDVKACLLNQTAVAAMRFKDPIGQTIRDGQNNFHVIGVIADFVQESPFRRIQPLIIQGKGPGDWPNNILIRLNGHHPINQDLAEVEKTFRKFEKTYPFEYSFVDEDYAYKFRIEQNAGTLAAIFTGLIIFISCLGLFGLAAYTAQGRIKEIGIRKVMGATVANISILLSREFVSSVALAILVAIPVSWLVMRGWLDNYEYHISISWDIFALSGVVALFIALATVSFQTIKAAIANPVKIFGPTNKTMFKNYFIIAWRNLIRNKSFSIINILGLAIGMASATLILLGVFYVAGADQSYPKLDRLYEVFSNDKLEGTIRTQSVAPELLAPSLQQSYPG